MGSDKWRSDKVRRPLAEVKKFVEVLTQEIPAGVEWHLGGSISRGAPTIGDLDVVFITESGTLEGIDLPKSFEPERKGDKISQGDLVVDGDRMHLDIWACSPKERGAFLMFITGPKELNVAQRKIAISKGYNLSQVGLLKDGVQVDNGTEQDIYNILGLSWLEPSQRQSFAAVKASERDYEERIVEGSKGNKYEIRIMGNRVSCNCPGFSYRSRCKHATAVREELGL